nr:retrovirus-related Pol polyprotein from transposon TNT 1-94 [Tanacetum cinerariifolium]
VRPIGTKWVLKNKKDKRGIVVRNKARLVAQGNTQEERIDHDEVFAPVARIKAIRLFLAYASFMGFIVYHMDVKSAFLYGTIDEEVYMMQPPRFQDPAYPAKVYKVEKAMYGLHQAPRAWHQVTPKECHLHAVKRIFRYLKGYPKLGLWYPKASPFDLVAYSDSDYGGASQDCKSTTGGSQFLGRRLISWQCKKQTIIATSTTEAEYVAAASCSSPLRYALTVKPTISVSHIRQFWSTARIETMDEGTHILAIVDGIQRTVGKFSASSGKFPSDSGKISSTSGKFSTNRGIIPVNSRLAEVLIVGYEHVVMNCGSARNRITKLNMFSLSERLKADITIRVNHMQHNISELTALCTSLQRQYSELLAKFQAQEDEIVRLKERVKVLEDREDVAATQSGDDAPIKGRSHNEEEAAAERISNDLEEIARVLTSINAATVLAGGIDVPTGSGLIPTAGPPATVISIGSEVGPIASLIVTRRKGKEVMDNYSKIYKFQSQQRRPMTKKQKREYYMAVIRSNLGWRVKDFKGMTFEEIEAKFAKVWKYVENFIPMGSKEETERLKRKGLNLKQEQVKKQKSSEEAPEIKTSTEEFTEEKMKEMMQLVPVEDVCV